MTQPRGASSINAPRCSSISPDRANRRLLPTRGPSSSFTPLSNRSCTASRQRSRSRLLLLRRSRLWRRTLRRRATPAELVEHRNRALNFFERISESNELVLHTDFRPYTKAFVYVEAGAAADSPISIFLGNVGPGSN